MNALVTGGAGFSGAHLVRALLARGDDVAVLDTHAGPATTALTAAGARVHVGSVVDPDAVRRAMTGREVVFHLASAFRDIYAPDAVYWQVDVEGTRTVLEAARGLGVRRVVHVSTQGVHGIVRNPPGDEDSPIAPRDSYCEAKRHSERVCHEFIAQGMDVVVVRPTSIYGPGDTHGWLKLFRTVATGWFVIVGHGNTLNHPLYVDNLVDGLLRAGEVPHAAGRTYLLGDAHTTTLNELVRLVAETQGVHLRTVRFSSYRLAWLVAAGVEAAYKPFDAQPPIFRRRLSWYRTERAFRIDRAVAELGYAPRVELREGLARTAAWYESQGLLRSRADGTVASGARP